jgi:hypothetical protein
LLTILGLFSSQLIGANKVASAAGLHIGLQKERVSFNELWSPHGTVWRSSHRFCHRLFQPELDIIEEEEEEEKFEDIFAVGEMVSNINSRFCFDHFLEASADVCVLFHVDWRRYLCINTRGEKQEN